MIRNLRAISTLALLLTPVCLGACQAASHNSNPSALTLNDVLVGPNQPVEAIPPHVRLYASVPATCTYRQIAGSPEPRTVERRYEPVTRDANHWVERTPTFNQVKHFRRDPDGTVRLLAVDDLDRQVRSRFEPGLVVFTPGLGGEPLTTDANVAVTDLEDPNKSVDRGKATLRVSCKQRRAVQTPAGRFDAYHIVTEFTSKFGVAQVNSRTDAYRAPDVGAVVEQYTEQGVAVVIPWQKTYTIVLSHRRSEL